MSLTEALHLTPLGPDRFGATLTEGWYQGRGVYGGLVAALLARAAGAAFGPPRALRTLHASFTAPAVAGDVEIRVAPLRVGRRVAAVGLRMQRGDDALAVAQATLAAPRPLALRFDESLAPPLPVPEAVPDGPAPLYVPAFCQHFEFRQSEGPAPFGAGMRAHLGGWCRPREPTPLDRALVVALLDAWAPAALCRQPAWAPAASVDLSVELPARLPEAPHDAFYAFVADCAHAADGYADERARLWTAEGAWLGRARQLVALFDPPP